MRGAVQVLFLALSLPLAAQQLPAAPTGPGAQASNGQASPGQREAGAQGSDAKKPAQKKTNRPPKVLSSPGSGETRAERTARLRRECKGMPNAGACTGMTD
jgi:hypothetical protein